jgi:hypothetical protein
VVFGVDALGFFELVFGDADAAGGLDGCPGRRVHGALAHLLGFDLRPRIRTWKELTFYRPSKRDEYGNPVFLRGATS